MINDASIVLRVLQAVAISMLG